VGRKVVALGLAQGWGSGFRGFALSSGVRIKSLDKFFC